MTKRKKERIYIGPRDALVIVDLQNDFCPGGALAVPGGDKIVSGVNKLIPLFGVVVATQDWHPPNHCSFKKYGGLWSMHCVANTRGAEYHPSLHSNCIQEVFVKGYSRERDEYSGFQGVGFEHGGLGPLLLKNWLSQREIKRIFIVGLATDYCVKATVLDGLKLGFEVYVVTDAIAAVNVNPGDGEKALQEMVAVGAKLCESSQVHPHA